LFIYGIFLHEFGHIASRGGELAADAWVFQSFGIPIRYRTRQRLEWVSHEDLKRWGL